jgi:hypothetical protein
MTAPLGSPPIWLAVIAAAGGRCECDGHCSVDHAAGRRNAELLPGAYRETRCLTDTTNHPMMRFYAIARSRQSDFRSAWRLPIEALAAFCEPCARSVERLRTKTHRAVTEPDVPLFDLMDQNN